MRFAVVLAMLASLSIPSLYAQPFFHVLLPQSPDAVALADAAVAAPTGDVLGMLYNPAFLGHPSASGLRISGAPTTAWLGIDDLDRSGYALSVGFDAQRYGLPLHVGLGVARSALGSGTFNYRNANGEVFGPELEPRQSFTAVSAGVGYNGAVRASIGIGLRWLEEVSTVLVGDGVIVDPFLPPSPENIADAEPLVLNATAVDLGVLVEVPIARLAGWRTDAQPEGFDLDVRLAYARTRGADELGLTPSLDNTSLFFDFYTRAAAATVVRLGWSASAGYDVAVGSGHVRAASLLLSVQADQDVSGLDDRDWFGSIRLTDALLGRGDDLQECDSGGGLCTSDPINPYVGRRGVQLELGETLSASFGRFEGGGFSATGDAPSAYGLVFSLGGLARLVGLLQENPRVYRLGDRFDLRLTRSVYFANDRDVDFDRSTVFWGTTLSARLP